VPQQILSDYLPTHDQQPDDETATSFHDQIVPTRFVLWHAPFTGDIWTGSGTILDQATQANLQAFVNQSGRLLVDGQDIAWALTQDNPPIIVYKEDRWAKLEDTRSTPIEVSLTLLEAVHERWDRVLRSLGPEDFARPLTHPERGPVTVDGLLGIYHWHSRHHVAHITRLRDRMGWD